MYLLMNITEKVKIKIKYWLNDHLISNACTFDSTLHTQSVLPPLQLIETDEQSGDT